MVNNGSANNLAAFQLTSTGGSFGANFQLNSSSLATYLLSGSIWTKRMELSTAGLLTNYGNIRMVSETALTFTILDKDFNRSSTPSIKFDANDSTGTCRNYAQIYASKSAVTSNNVYGSLGFYVGTPKGGRMRSGRLVMVHPRGILHFICTMI